MKDRLFTPSYCCILAANFLLYFGFWLLIPLLPFYLKEEFTLEEGIIGIILSCYTISALMVRPFSGYLLDTFARKPLYLLAYATASSPSYSWDTSPEAHCWLSYCCAWHTAWHSAWSRSEAIRSS